MGRCLSLRLPKLMPILRGSRPNLEEEENQNSRLKQIWSPQI